MACKRKRSFSDDSPSSVSSDFSSFRSSESPTPIPRPQFSTLDATAISSPLSLWTGMSSSLDATNPNCRTRKRWRDNRPKEQLIHESTIQRLFDAQRHHPHASPVPSQPHAPMPAAATSHQKTTLHSFWLLPQTPCHIAPSTHIGRAPVEEPTRCEHCDEALQQSVDGMDIDLGDAFAASDECSCAGCGKMVCDSCAVVREDRKCLLCATAR